MKKLILLIFLTLITVGCKCEETLTVYSFKEQEKILNPYQLNENIHWIDNENIIHNGMVTKYNEDYSVSSNKGGDCNTIKFHRLITHISFNNFKYLIYIQKIDNNRILLTIQETIENNTTKSFESYVTLDDFGIINLNGDTYENSKLIYQYDENGNPISELVYSKTHGIEFILFEDGTLYKRVE